MNIFAVHDNPIISAQQLCDKHVVKMIVESCQLLSTAHRLLDGYEDREKTKSGKTRKIYRMHDPEMESKLARSQSLTCYTTEHEDYFNAHASEIYGKKITATQIHVTSQK